jgi:hypothetical protein
MTKRDTKGSCGMTNYKSLQIKEGYKRIFNLLFHIDIIGDKIWIQEDKME